MLTHLRIQNFAIIPSLELDIPGGLSAFTGETGAGKSIILDAIEILMGGKTDIGQIRAGEEKAVLEGVFSLPENPDPAFMTLLTREDLLEENDEIMISREIRREGRSPARVNGRSVAGSLLREIGSYLADIHGQSEHLSLLNIRQHLRLLDSYAGSEAWLQAYQQEYHLFQALQRELAELKRNEREATQRSDLLQFQVQEIESARLQPDEEEPLKQERDRLANAESLASLAQESLLLLDEGNSETIPLSETFGQVVSNLDSLIRYDASLQGLSETAHDLEERLTDLSRDLRDYQEKIEFNPRRLDQIEDRLNLIHRLKKKYGADIPAVLMFGKEARDKLESLKYSGERMAELEIRLEDQKKRLQNAARVLSEHRREATGRLEAAIEKELADLSMSGARFQVEMKGGLFSEEADPHYGEYGFDQVQFLIAPNPGEGLQPMVKIASGGETSRLMLALKNVLAHADAVPTLIFDEIDQGISGQAGSMVGEKLWRLGREHQVLCVTHLAQLAAFGDQHYSVRKLVDNNRTSTQVIQLSADARVRELAQLTGNSSETGLASAQELLERAAQKKQLWNKTGK